jgi:hypothetical protein
MSDAFNPPINAGNVLPASVWRNTRDRSLHTVAAVYPIPRWTVFHVEHSTKLRHATAFSEFTADYMRLLDVPPLMPSEVGFGAGDAEAALAHSIWMTFVDLRSKRARVLGRHSDADRHDFALYDQILADLAEAYPATAATFDSTY